MVFNSRLQNSVMPENTFKLLTKLNLNFLGLFLNKKYAHMERKLRKYKYKQHSFLNLVSKKLKLLNISNFNFKIINIAKVSFFI